MFRLDKRRIFLLYNFYLNSEENDSVEQRSEFFLKEIIDNVIDNEERRISNWEWLKECLKKREELEEKIDLRLKEGWNFKRLPILEKAILVYSLWESFSQKKIYFALIINQSINFSKSYLEENKFAYINKILDLISKDN